MKILYIIGYIIWAEFGNNALKNLASQLIKLWFPTFHQALVCQGVSQLPKTEFREAFFYEEPKFFM